MQRPLFLIAIVAMFGATMAGAGVVPAVAAGDIDPRLAPYPELRIRLTGEKIESPLLAMPGPTVLIQEQLGTGVGHAFVLRVPDDVDDAEVAAALDEPPAVEVVPEWFWRAEFFGNGDRAVPERPAFALVDLKPGRYLVGDPYRPKIEYARFAVAEGYLGGRTVQDEPAADVAAALFEMGFRVPEPVPAGRQLWKVSNTGAMLHEIAIVPVPGSATQEQIEAAIGAELAVERGGDPAAARTAIDALGPPWQGWSSRFVAGVGAISPQRAALAQFTLDPGTYAAVCFVPLEDGTPHLMLGMTEVFSVAAG